jgi:hypothetical protein
MVFHDQEFRRLFADERAEQLARSVRASRGRGRRRGRRLSPRILLQPVAGRRARALPGG